MFERENFNPITQITRVSLRTLIYNTRKSLEQQGLNVHSNITKTELAHFALEHRYHKRDEKGDKKDEPEILLEI